jgi:hypothetical protein
MLPDFPPEKTICHLFSTWNKKVFGEIPGTRSIKFIKKNISLSQVIELLMLRGLKTRLTSQERGDATKKVYVRKSMSW